MVHGAKSKASKEKSAKEKKEKQKEKQDVANKKRDEQNKKFKESQKAFDKKFNTQKFRAETSEAGGRFPNPGGSSTTRLDRKTIIKLGIEQARETNRAIREQGKLTDEEEDELRKKDRDEPRSPIKNIVLGAGVSFRDIESQKNVKNLASQRTKTQ